MVMRQIGRLLRRLHTDQRGVSALEFALIAPIMIVMFFGVAEVGQGIVAQRRVQHVGAAIGDLTAQAQSVSNADLSNIFDAGGQIMTPLTTAKLSMRLTHVTTDAQQRPIVVWSSATGTLSANPVGSVYTLPTGLVNAASQSVVISEATYPYVSPIGYVLPNGMNFAIKSYLSPRFGVVTKK
jgi:Flp pilus assembly protein TadG